MLRSPKEPSYGFKPPGKRSAPAPAGKMGMGGGGEKATTLMKPSQQENPSKKVTEQGDSNISGFVKSGRYWGGLENPTSKSRELKGDYKAV